MITKLNSDKTLDYIAGGAVTLEQIQAIEEFNKKTSILIKRAHKNCNVTQYSTDHSSCLAEDYNFAMIHWQFIHDNMMDFYNSYFNKKMNEEL